ncbi:MAG TPA: Gfo/Idh/MocA family oxidoreductase [Sedimentisphaerales bacterium]|jgi:predicted dehydrogenase|nr:Gfo/Idh/MocA family oxidoreductase [Sedimentisphaerales bacterium]HNU30068.1 Gfo/Idh/MocA family oxidoreductase [Sedimentisphaerales bacterium]
MGSERLTTAILGLNETGRRMLKAVSATGLFQVKAVADLDQQKASKTAAEFECEAYSDYRQLIVQNQLDCLLVAAETHTCDEQIRMAIRKKCHILKATPPARTFAEALEFTLLARSEDVQFIVANPGRFKAGVVAARDLISQGRLGSVFLVAAHCTFAGSSRPAWQIDPQVAGGGVLLHDCYQVLDQILWSFPLPEQVYALKTNRAPDKQQRLCLTEDTAVVSMRFNDASMGSLVATCSSESEAPRTVVEIHGKEGILTVTDGQVTLQASDSQTDQKWHYQEDEPILLERLLESFARSLQTPDEHEFPCSDEENLRTMAVLESAYLSARTGFPEQPARILTMAGHPISATTTV